MNPHPSNSDTVTDDAVLPLEPDGDEPRDHFSNPGTPSQANAARVKSGTTRTRSAAPDSGATRSRRENAAPQTTTVSGSGMGANAGHMSDILRWALDSLHEPALASADWLARDIDPDQPSAEALLTNPRITLVQVHQAKSVFKTMRIVGEKSADRRVGARMYAAAIAAGLVRHGRLVSRQSDDALRRGFQGLLDDHRMPTALRDLAGMGLCALNDRQFVREAPETTRSSIETSTTARNRDARQKPRPPKR